MIKTTTSLDPKTMEPEPKRARDTELARSQMDTRHITDLPYPALILVTKYLNARDLLNLSIAFESIYNEVKNSVKPVIYAEYTNMEDLPYQMQFYQTMLKRFPRTELRLVMRFPNLMEYRWREEKAFIQGQLNFARSVILSFPDAPIEFTGAVGIRDENPAKQFLLHCITEEFPEVFIKIAETMSVEDLQTPWPHMSGQTLLNLADGRRQVEIAQYIRGRIANNTAGRSMYVM